MPAGYRHGVAGAPPLDVDGLVAIDVHTHVQASVTGRMVDAASPEAAVAEVFGSERVLTVPQLATYYRERRMACVAFTVDTVRWGSAASNEEVLELAVAESDALVPFVSIDPHRGAGGVRQLRQLVAAGARGVKFHPTLQEFFPDDRSLAYPLYEVAAEHRLPAVFHTGQTAVGSGQRGGGGMLLKYSDPLHLDQVAADFPDMTVVMAHPAVPFTDVALSIAGHKPNVYMDLSGWGPRYLPPNLVRQASNLLKHKLLFGTDFPALTPERWMADFDTLDVKPEVRPLILKGNAALVLGLVS